MTEGLSDENRRYLVKYRIERACQTLKEAAYLREGGYFNAGINRLYYACFYAVLALLLANKIEATTHNGVKTMLGLHFVKTGKISIEYGSLYSDLFDKRHSGDYDDMFFIEGSTFDFLYPKAVAFVDKIKNMLSSSPDVA